ncbi:LemA family protein [Tessaracoccus palaemonis]|uniref:LemA family protein n=1 Tax=Tessaracoccus palaemonis TaxID=2829499 RepID=A0ABX8SNK4_9ACTN|nr:LemA family protein [Tessaracoccus palaemonis]
MALIIVLVVIVGIIAWGVGSYNSFVRARNVIQESWRQIDVELNRRYDLIPNLVETVRGYAAHERNTLEQITALRNQARQLAASAQGAPTQERAAVEQELTQAVHGLMVSVEAYPDLKSNTNFLELQRELTDTEDRIAAARRFYNANVREYNTKIDSVPTNVIAGFAKFEKATYFEVNDPAVRQAPGVNFGEISQRPAGSAEPQQLPTNTQQPPVQPPSATPQISTDPFAQENQNKGPFQG